ncbi:MAG: hypothetical protein M0R22_00505 [Dehalococcoidia bacterium]|jgi:hypothetical protein|nr:hypothetical protein [Dehalococcoidia bacterium]
MGIVRLSAHEIDDFQRVMRAVATNASTSVACRHATLVGNAYTQWCIRSGVSVADPTSDGDFDEVFFPPALDVLFAQAVTVFVSGHCDNLSALEQRQLEEAARWAFGGSGSSWFQFASLGVGLVGLGLAAWTLWGKKGRRR